MPVHVQRDADPITVGVRGPAASPASSASRCSNWSLLAEVWLGKCVLVLSTDLACYHSKGTCVTKTLK